MPEFPLSQMTACGDWDLFRAILADPRITEEVKCKVLVRQLADAWTIYQNREPFSSGDATESAVNEFQCFIKDARKLAGLPEVELTPEEKAKIGDEDEEENAE